ncbi:MAG: polysaccharide biosynthesis tyrosine autokinase [Rothia sp. (in: high G+C Gram-positive bacteria)]|nr:polysaccharide biosynthesis tyrosine autokinase [Rothia sp. (in: high G+C Gram-positive bacteria)]
MTILDFVRLLRANAKYLLSGLLIGALLGFGYSLTQPKVYASSASGFVTIGESTGIGDVISGSSVAKDKANSYLALVSSGPVAEEILKENPNIGMSTAEIKGNLSASLASDSALIKVQATGSTPEAAQTLANTSLTATAKVVNDLEGSTAVRVVPLEDATLPGGPSSPNFKKNILAGALAGLLLVFAIIFLRRALDVKVRTRDDVTSSLNAGVLGTLPDTEQLAEKNLLNNTDDHASQEAIRQLRTNLRFVNVDNPPKSVLITSSEPGEGKSTVSVSLARSLAESGQPTILIDADLRRPTIGKKFNIDSKVGLTQVLAGQIELANAVRQFEDTQLFLLPSGRIPPNPSELLGSEKMHQLVKELSSEFMVVIDVPPLLPVTDASLLSSAVDGVILVATVGKTRKEHLTEAGNMLTKVGATLIGAVINRTPLRGLGSSYYGFGYAGSYGGYSSYYGEDKSKSSSRKRGSRRAKDKK